MFIQTEATPNPATLKFLPGRVVMPEGTFEARTPDAADASPLARRLFAITGVTEPMSVIPVGALVFALIAANVVAASSKSRPQAPDGAEPISKDPISSGETGGT